MLVEVEVKNKDVTVRSLMSGTNFWVGNKKGKPKQKKGKGKGKGKKKKEGWE